MKPSLRHLPWVALVAVLVSSCGDDTNDDTCVLGTSEGCNDGQICEVVPDGEPTCFAPAQIEGQIFDLSTGSGIEDARIVALDANGAARSAVAFSGPGGEYELDIRIPRDAEGNPLAEQVTLRVAAAGYQPFPKAPRTPIAIDVGSAVYDEDQDEWVVQNAATDVGLLPFDGDVSTLGSVSGSVAVPDGLQDDGGAGSGVGGILIVAEAGGEAVSTAITDEDGNFLLYNLPEGEVTITGYRQGIAIESTTVTVTAGEELTGVELGSNTDDLGSVTGTVNIVNAPGDAATSVILIVKSTFESYLTGSLALELTFIRGDAPAGLRADDVRSSYTIDGVPPGDYIVLGAFEDDNLVRDPDVGIAGTDIVEVTVTAGETVSAGEFKITEDLEVCVPGTETNCAPNTDAVWEGIVEITDPQPTFVWAQDAGAAGYELRVFNAYGELVCSELDIADIGGSVPMQEQCDDDDTGETFTAEPGMVYQFRVLSYDGAREYQSASEDLQGVFRLPAPSSGGDGGVLPLPDGSLLPDAGVL